MARKIAYFASPKLARFAVDIDKLELDHDNESRATGYHRHNHHPTVKPLKWERFRVALVTPPGGVVLDPFGGSGTTGVAALELGFDVVLAELDPGHCDIIRARLAHASASE